MLDDSHPDVFASIPPGMGCESYFGEVEFERVEGRKPKAKEEWGVMWDTFERYAAVRAMMHERRAAAAATPPAAFPATTPSTSKTASKMPMQPVPPEEMDLEEGGGGGAATSSAGAGSLSDPPLATKQWRI